MTSQLDELLARWADQQRLTDAQAVTIRRAVLRTEPAVELDVDWFWSLLRPVMDLIPSGDPTRPLGLAGTGPLPYLRLV